MTTHHLVAHDGTIVLRGAMLHATKGPHAGTHWRLDDIVRKGAEHVLRCSRYVRKVGRVFEHFHPSVFGLDVIEISRWFQITRHDIARCWHRIDDGLFMGFLALVPLAVFEGFHGGENTRRFLEALFGR